MNEVFKIIGALKTKFSSGHYGLSTKMIKLCSPVKSVFLANILNKCIDSADFPDACKIAKIVAFLKEGDRENPSSYRPFSLLTVFSKIFEKLIYKRMLVFINKNNILIRNTLISAKKILVFMLSFELLNTCEKQLRQKICAWHFLLT